MQVLRYCKNQIIINYRGRSALAPSSTWTSPARPPRAPGSSLRPKSTTFSPVTSSLNRYCIDRYRQMFYVSRLILIFQNRYWSYIIDYPHLVGLILVRFQLSYLPHNILVLVLVEIVWNASCASQLDPTAGFRIRIFFADPDPSKNLHADPDPVPYPDPDLGVKGKNDFFFSFFHVSDDS